MTLTTQPDIQRPERRRNRWSLLAMAAAIVAAVAGGVFVAQMMTDDDAQAPTATLPSPTTVPTATLSSTTAPSNSTVDEDAAVTALLRDADQRIEGVRLASGGQLPVRFDASIAESLPACQRFVPTVFESDNRPAVIKDSLFVKENFFGPVMSQYVAVLPTEEQAVSMLAGIRDPAFLSECVPAYTAVTGVDAFFPFNAEPFPAGNVIEVDADDVWVARRVFSWTHEGEFFRTDEITAVVRVGRIVTILFLTLTGEDQRQIATIDEFEQIVQTMAARAAEAQAVS
jgi:hypothetical protein